MNNIIGKRLLLLFLPLWEAGTGGAQTYPNLLVIHTDEQNFRTLGCYRSFLSEKEGNPWGKGNIVETPHIDSLAEQGVLFMRCYATTPVSSPSRASFMTGLYPQNAGVLTNDMVLYEQVFTFGEAFRRQGYDTGYFGKLHLNGKGRPEWYPVRDFGFTDNRYMYNRGHWKKVEETEKGPEFLQDADIKTTDLLSFTTDFLTDRVIEFIQRDRNVPFCCMLSIPDPHSPNQVRAPYDTMYQDLHFQHPSTSRKDTIGLPAWSYGGNLPGDRMEDMSQYFGMIKCIDDNIGRILNVLSDRRLLDNTIVVFTSDHGDLCGEHGLINKGVPLDGSARVPFIIRYPKGMACGIKVSHVMSVVDFTPSILSFCGIRPTRQLDGRDLSDLWRGKDLPEGVTDAVFMRAITPMIAGDWDESATAQRTQWISIVTPQYKLTLSEHPSDLPWLTDLSKDPDELINCYSDSSYQKTVSLLEKRLVEYGKRYRDPRVDTPKIKRELINHAK